MTMRKPILLLVAMAGLAGLQPAMAQYSPAIAEGQAAGVIGERYDGYMGFVTTPSEALRKQVAAINIRRRALYANLAQRKGVSTEEVSVTAGCSTLRRVGVGEAYLLGEGGWQRRAAGQPAPVPAYCG